ncbi:MAG: triphosphatase [Alphaproteobacteria bacterium]|jgi:inorganic triphosphatase YgiF|nr:triphosphatase [Alphaproteobacteria bacterium]
MNNGRKEIELKLRVKPEDIAVIRSHPNFSGVLRDPTSETQVSVYFDSDKLLLRDHGLTLRVRHIGDKRIQTIKSVSRGSGIFERSEWEQPIEGDQPNLAGVADTALGPILTDDIRGALKPVFETRIERTAYHLNGNDTDIAIAFDNGRIVATDSSCPVSEIELELKHGNPAELFKLARAIGELVPAQLDVKSKSERGYDLIEKASGAAEAAHEAELSAGTSAGRAFTLIGRACLRQLLANEPATIKRDAEGLHQMRIALRRLRAAISLFFDVVSDSRTEAVKAELRWLGREFAPARDLDSLLIEVLRPLRKQQANEPGFASISRMFARERLKSYRRAQEAVQSPRFRKLVLDTAEWIEAGPWCTSDDPLLSTRRAIPIETLAAEQLSRRRKKIRRRGAEIGELSPEQLHQLRIQIKKTRYATEFFAGVYQGKKAGKRCEKFRTTLKQLQNCLGGFNDIMTRKALCTDIIAQPGRSLTAEQNRHRAFAAGLIMGDQQAQIAQLLDRARKAHARFDDAKPFWK